LRAIAAAIETLGPLRGRTLTIAMPDPFDYEAGIGRFRGVAKFDALNGVNVRQALLDTLAEPPDAIEFLNDAVAFGIGEWVSGAIQGCERALAITLGTGVGSAFIDKGHPVASGDAVPPHGTVHRLEVDGQPLEDLVSRRAIISAYRRYQGDSTASASPASSAASASSAGELDVRHIAERADDGDAAALRALQEPCRILGSALAPWIDRFGAEALVIGGGITASWPLLAPPLREGLGSDVRVVRSRDPEESAEVGAAWHTVSRAGGPSVPRSADLRP
jgi:glucokinase